MGTGNLGKFGVNSEGDSSPWLRRNPFQTNRRKRLVNGGVKVQRVAV
jgi:hypothetical protein